MKKPLFVGIILLFLISCSDNKNSSNSLEVKHFGALRAIMHKNDLSAKVDLQDIRQTAHGYALGALENLKGEILIFDGQPLIAYQEEDNLVIDTTFDHKASLLVHTAVEEWDAFPITGVILSYKNLEAFIQKTAAESGINTEEPFPFLIEGQVKTADWHVINWKDGDTNHSHQKHMASGMQGTIANRAVDILGFYSEHHKGIFTHHTTFLHMHIKTRAHDIVGHVDDLKLGANMLLKLPRQMQ